MIYLFLVGLNVFLIFFLRFLVKRNIFLHKLAYLFIGLQIILATYGLFRERLFHLVTFLQTYLTIALILSSIVIIPILLDRILSARKKEELTQVEQNFKSYLLESYDILIENRPKLASLFDRVSKKLTSLLAKILFSNNLFWLVGTPWLFFINFFIYEVLSKSFLYSPYLLAYWLFSYRFLVILLYIVKNTIAYDAISILRLEMKFFLVTDISMLLNFSLLTSLVLNQKNQTKQEKRVAWNYFKRFLDPFTDFAIVHHTYYYELALLKITLDRINFCLILATSTFLIVEFFFFRSLVLFYFVLSTLIFLVIFSISISTQENQEKKVYRDFFELLVEYIAHFKYILIHQHAFFRDEVDESPLTFRLSLPTDFIKILAQIFLVLASFFGTILWIFLGGFLVFTFEDFLFHKILKFLIDLLTKSLV